MSGERLQDHWSSGIKCSTGSFVMNRREPLVLGLLSGRGSLVTRTTLTSGTFL